MDPRAILAYIAAGALSAGFFLGKIDAILYAPAMVGAIAWWFSDAKKEATLKAEIKKLEEEKAKLLAPKQ
jgi:hypothetical protein